MSKIDPAGITTAFFESWRKLEAEQRELVLGMVQHLADRDGELRSLLGAWRQLAGAGDERAVLLAVAERLVAGRAVYGELQLKSDPRDMKRECFEEAIDGFVYACAALVRGERGAKGGSDGQA